MLANLPPTLLYIGAIYAALFLVGGRSQASSRDPPGFLLCVEKPLEEKVEKVRTGEVVVVVVVVGRW